MQLVFAMSINYIFILKVEKKRKRRRSSFNLLAQKVKLPNRLRTQPIIFKFTCFIQFLLYTTARQKQVVTKEIVECIEIRWSLCIHSSVLTFLAKRSNFWQPNYTSKNPSESNTQIAIRTDRITDSNYKVHKSNDYVWKVKTRPKLHIILCKI